MKPLVTVAVCTYNDEQTIGLVLDAILRLSYRPLEVLVINDASTDGTAGILEKYDVKVVHNPINRGLGFNQNLALKMAQGEYLVLIQSDCVVATEDWLDQMMELMQDDVAVVVSQRIIEDFRALPLGARWFQAVAPQDLHNENGEPEEILYCRGKADLYRRSILKELGGWNREFFTAGEDTDLSIRLRQRGYKILLHPTARVRYLFSGRQVSVSGALKKAFLYGRVAYPLYHLHRYDGIQSRTYLTLILSLCSFPLTGVIQLFCGILLLSYSFTCKIQRRSATVPYGILAFIASLPLVMINFLLPFVAWNSLPILSLVVSGLSYTGYLAAKNAARNWNKGERISGIPGTFLFAVAWRLISGIGYLAGAVEFWRTPSWKRFNSHESLVD